MPAFTQAQIEEADMGSPRIQRGFAHIPAWFDDANGETDDAGNPIGTPRDWAPFPVSGFAAGYYSFPVASTFAADLTVEVRHVLAAEFAEGALGPLWLPVADIATGNAIVLPTGLGYEQKWIPIPAEIMGICDGRQSYWRDGANVGQVETVKVEARLKATTPPGAGIAVRLMFKG